MDAPDLSKKVIGYRWFRREGRDLASLNAGPIWMPGPNKARCDFNRRAQARHASRMAWPSYGLLYGKAEVPPQPPEPKKKAPHAVPSPDCECGLYAYHSVPEMWAEGGLGEYIGAVVRAWGRMEVHREGFRAEFAEIGLLVYDPFCGPTKLKKIQKAAKLYGVETVSLADDLAADPRVLALGEGIPESLLPEEPPPPPPAPDPVTVEKWVQGGGPAWFEEAIKKEEAVMQEHAQKQAKRWRLK